MKFFDLELNWSLAKLSALKRGSRDISFADGGICNQWKYSHGDDWDTCAENRFKDMLESPRCMTHFDDLYK